MRKTGENVKNSSPSIIASMYRLSLLLSFTPLVFPQRRNMASEHGLVGKLVSEGILRTERLIRTMKHIDRAKYLHETWGGSPYDDHPVPIGDGQTISAPHMHAFALQILDEYLKPGNRVLDIGSGSGYLTACFGELVSPTGHVLGIENRESLVHLGRDNILHANPELVDSGVVSMRLGNGWTGEGFWKPGDALFDAIHVGAAGEKVPEVLLECLKAPGKMVIPVGLESESQSFLVVTKHRDGSVSQEE